MFQRNFTLIELMLTVVIAMVIAGLSTVGYSYAMRASKVAATKATIKKVELVLDGLHKKYGVYPPVGSNNLKINTDASTVNDLGGTALPNYFGEFVKNIDFENLKTVETAKDSGIYIIVDAWEHPLYYKCPGVVNTKSFDLVSAGIDDKVFSQSYTTADDLKDTNAIANFLNR